MTTIIKITASVVVVASLLSCTPEMRQMRGAEVHIINATVTALHAAAVASVEAEGLTIHGNTNDQQTAQVLSRYADGKNVTILMEGLNASTSELTIRVGSFGDKPRQATLLQGIQARLQ